jgi:N-acetylmuramoyl-L-alanine amidase
MRIYLDPGHGGGAPGAIGPAGLQEKDLNLQIAELLFLACGRRGWHAIRSRTKDNWIANSVRAQHANEWAADVFVSIHCNAVEDSRAQGHEVLFWHPSMKGAFLADAIEMALGSQFPARPARGPKPKRKGDRGAPVLSQTSMPAVIVECGFISNSFEEGWLASFPTQAAIAWAICQGVERTCPEPNGGAPL